MTVWLKAKPTGRRIEHGILERPLLHACCGDDSDWFFGDVRVDLDPGAHPDVIADVRVLPFRDDAFAAVFADVPWVEKWKWQMAGAMREFLRVAPVAYIMAPWIWGSRAGRLESVAVCYQPGIHHPILFARYLRPSGLVMEQE